MIDSYRRNSARNWLLRLGFLCLFALVSAGFLVISAPQLAGSFVSAPPLNTALNLTIVAAFVVGLGLVLVWLSRAAREERLINHFAGMNLKPGAHGDGEWHMDGIGRSAIRDRVQLLLSLKKAGAAPDATALADVLAEREEPRIAVARYTANVLVLLGLLGTFVGLLITIAGISEVVEGLSTGGQQDIEAFLIPLKAGLRTPLQGMSFAFSTSLLGLAGSLVLGAGALALAAAQGAWMTKLEELTTAFLVPSLGLAARPAGAQGGGGGGAGVSTAALVRLETTTRYLRDAQTTSGEHAARLEAAGERIAGSLGDFRNGVGELSNRIDALSVLLARIADNQGASQQAVQEQSARLVELSGAAQAVRADVRDGQAAMAAAVQASARGLHDGVSGALGGLAQTLAEGPGVAELREAIESLNAEMARASADRREEARVIVEYLRRMLTERDAAETGGASGARRGSAPGHGPVPGE